ncbi:hypothetical protein [Clostridium beijerinckii]|uniref:hypothetical protein n=1 Tax=Clostridium beijerinckii TaxID=1520 RepID=UPI00098CA486|nr:hypothetical protein [Clostridium beijerinckii]MBA8937215.1 hypothetical protein [Clostridium beijerinckii]NRU40319.1 hypothetical protein [Clostridium beijerinckii]NSA96404.1 hypothetical protein [Clostridium beijerinckii]OOM66033.1 hypothetical protein CLOBI_08730 [Clostridium beijerinckii]OOM72068.1 hypothetical protein CLBEIC_08130 [Clostridium beijerinckii]
MNEKLTQVRKGFKQIFNSSELYRPTYPLNFVENLSDNDEIWEKDISGSVDKEIRYLFFIYMKIISEFGPRSIIWTHFY